MTARRRFIAMAGALLVAQASAEAQQVGKTATIGYLGNSSAALESGFVDAFRQGMRAHGYNEGANLAVIYRWAEGRNERLAELAAELVRLKVEVVITAGTPGTLAAKRATATTPIVMVAVGDAVGAGLGADAAGRQEAGNCAHAR